MTSVLDKSTGFLLARTARSMKRTLETRLAEFRITASQYIVLAQLESDDGISLSQLGDKLFFDNPTMTGIIDRMERDSLVERRRIAEDRRVINVFITKKGRLLLEHCNSIAEELNELALTDFPISERKKFLNTLDAIWKKMNGGSD